MMNKMRDSVASELIMDLNYEYEFVENLSGITYEGINNVESFDSYKTKVVCDKKIISVCVTVYNENKESFISTYFSLMKAINYANFKMIDEYQYNICIIVDGIDSMCPLFFEWAASYGLLEENTDFYKCELSVFKTRIYHLESSNCKIENQCQRIFLDFCIGRENKGKLNSHKWFFEYFCKKSNPEYVIQIDVGVTLEVECIQHIIESFSEPNVAGVAACPLPESPRYFDILSNWQYLDLLSERLVQWQIESYLNYVSVLPGQLHALRWKSVHCEDVSLLPMYFKDLGGLGFFEANMYLAEDRVLGIGISYGETGEKNWKLTYQADARATIDICETWLELLKQRRRWVCGAFACKLKMFEKIKNAAFKKMIFEPKKYLLSPVYQAATMIMDFFYPSIALLLYAAFFLLAKECLVAFNYRAAGTLNLAMVLSVAIFVASFFACGAGYIGKIKKRYIDILCWYQSIFLLVLFGIIIAFNKVQYLWVLLFLVALLFVFGVIMNTGGNVFSETKRMFHYFFSRPFVNFIVQAYAVTNMADTCWGTKGKARPINYIYIESLSKWSLRFKKYNMTAIYLLMNLLVFSISFVCFLPETFIYFIFLFQIFSILWAIGSSIDKEFKKCFFWGR